VNAEYGLDRGLEYDQRSGARCVEGAHRFSFLDRDVAMLITCGDLGVQQQRGVVFVLAVTADICQTSCTPSRLLQLASED